MNTTLATQLKLYGQDEDPHMFFDHVVFCTNVTYADGAHEEWYVISHT